MGRVLGQSWLRSAGAVRVALVLLIAILGVGGYLLTSTTIRRDRDRAASNRSEVEAVQAQEVLGRARAYVQGLSDLLASERRATQARFATLARGTAASVGLNDVLWVQTVARSERGRYERRLGASIVDPAADGHFERAPEASSYLPATFTSRTRPELRPGADASRLPGLAAAIRDRATVFAVTASRRGSLGAEPGFYLLEAAVFGRGPGSRGYLAAFIPRGWFTTTLGGDPRRVAISEDGRRIEGELGSAQAAASFDALGRRWRIDVAREPPSGLQSTLPWLVLAWPIAVALIALGVGRAIVLRRRAEREVEASRDDLRVLAQEQSALRRVATLVARGGPPTDVLEAVCEEVNQLLGADSTRLLRLEPDGAATILATHGEIGAHTPVGTRSPLDQEGTAAAAVLRTGRPARAERYVGGPDSMAASVRKLGFRSGVAAPISVDGRLWGVIGAGWKGREPPLAQAEGRMAEFTELVATAIANAESRAELAASRARVVTATAEERRRLVRDLHDGAQQYLVHAMIVLKLALREQGAPNGATEALVGEALEHAERANTSLRELARGILPTALTRGGLLDGIEELVSRSSLPVTTDVSAERLPPAIEATAYFVVSEALTNVLKHSGADSAVVTARVEGRVLRVEVRDDGVGGAGPAAGSGFTGLRDRVEALGGTIEIASPPGRGTSLSVEIPIDGH